jgi:hypothetical protein
MRIAAECRVLLQKLSRPQDVAHGRCLDVLRGVASHVFATAPIALFDQHKAAGHRNFQGL